MTKANLKFKIHMIHFNVDFSVYNSFSDITFALACALEQLGVPVSMEKCSISSDFLEHRKLIEKWMDRSPYPFCHIKWSHYWRADFYRKLNGQINLEFFAINYEFHRKDQQFDYWMTEAIANSNKKLAISQFCKDVLIKGGCSPSDVFVLPLGFNSYLENLELQPEKTSSKDGIRVILTTTLSSDLYRFGTDLLLPAFCEEFKGEEDVQLLIKEPGMHNFLIERLIFSMSDKLGRAMPKIRYLSQFMSKKELAKVYLSADAFVAPFRGEGFAIKVLDAFAAGLPVAIPLYGGVTEYANSTNCYPIEYDRVPVLNGLDAQSIPLKNSPHWAQVNIESLRKQLRHIIDAPQRYQVAKRAKETAAQFSWECTAKKLLAIVNELS